MSMPCPAGVADLLRLILAYTIATPTPIVIFGVLCSVEKVAGYHK